MNIIIYIQSDIIVNVHSYFYMPLCRYELMAEAYLNAVVLEAKDYTGVWLRAQQRYLTLLPVNFYKTTQDYMRYKTTVGTFFVEVFYEYSFFLYFKTPKNKMKCTGIFELKVKSLHIFHRVIWSTFCSSQMLHLKCEGYVLHTKSHHAISIRAAYAMGR